MKRKSKEHEDTDLGFGTKVTNDVQRLLNRDGSFNVKRSGLSFFQSSDMYHKLISISWLEFNMMVLVSYIVINTFFALIYYSIGIEHLAGVEGDTVMLKFIDSFFFSAQTLTTVGYGRISPVGFTTSAVAAIESLTGLLGFALATGLLYGRFSRAVAKILWSDTMLIAPYRGITSLQFRIANARSNQLIEIEVQLILSRVETHHDNPTRQYHALTLERKTINFFASSWTVVHPIDENSPLFGVDKKALDDSDAEFMILIKAFDDTFSQTVHTRSSYKHHEVVWGAKFTTMFKSDKGHTLIYLDKISDFERVELPVIQFSELQEN